MSRLRWVVVLVLFGSLVGCGGSDEPDPSLANRAEATRALALETFSLVREAVETSGYATGGGGQWTICGMEPSPSGAEYVAEVAITGSSYSSSEQTDRIVSALKSAGWKVDPPTSELVAATKDGFAFRAKRATNLSITGGCMDASGKVIDRLTDGARDELGLQQPS